MAGELAILEDAISDVGVWSWWTAEAPHTFQIEFSGTQLWNPPLQENGPPNSQIALRFQDPALVGFLTRRDCLDAVPTDWPQRLQNDQMESLNLAPDSFTLTAFEEIAPMVADASHVDVLIGNAASARAIPFDAAILGLWSGPVGLIVAAKSMKIFNYEGEVHLDQIEAMHQKWWDYWEEYWKRKNSPTPMPRDYACEVTIPTG